MNHKKRKAVTSTWAARVPVHAFVNSH